MSPRANLTEQDLTKLIGNRDGMGRPKKDHCNIGDGTPVKSFRRTGSSPVAVSTQYRSKWEANFAAKLELEKQAGLIKAYWYEPFSLWLPGKVRYKPDFMVELHPVNPWGGQISPSVEIVEVKGWSKNRRDGITRLKMAAALFPCFVWRLVWMKTGGGFDGEYI